MTAEEFRQLADECLQMAEEADDEKQTRLFFEMCKAFMQAALRAGGVAPAREPTAAT